MDKKPLMQSKPVISHAGDYEEGSARRSTEQHSAAPLIENAADYIDALTRPRSDNSYVHKKGIVGRRMRDKYRMNGVVVTEVVKKIA
ncbi:MAG TPA: hypothetical protein VN496_02795 [Burkholderiales bacterium]|nr:hypothetical protein [Burkholderiales bacterium]